MPGWGWGIQGIKGEALYFLCWEGWRGVGLEAEIEADHGFGGVSEGVGGGEDLRHIRGGIEVAAVLEAEADVGEETPVEAGTVDVDGFVGGRGG